MVSSGTGSVPAYKRAIELESLFDFVSYHYFDASKYPNLVELLRSQGVEPREPLEMPNRCKT